MSGFIFRRVGVGRLPGVEEGGGFVLRDLAAGINIVHGPNGSGKSTTARALEALVWPRAIATPDARLNAVAELDGARWSIDVESGQSNYQKDGVGADAPSVPPPEGRDRYRLWLPDLLRAEDAGLAREILVESSGGFDLERAAKPLEPRRPAHRHRQAQAELRQAREAARSALALQETLSREATALAEKESRLERRNELSRRLDLYRRAEEYVERVELADARRAELAAFSGKVSRLRGDEARVLEELRDRARSARGAHAAAVLARRRAERDLEKLAVPEGVVDGDVLQRLTADVDALAAAERTIDAEDRRLQDANTRLVEAEKGLPGVEDPTRLAALDLTGIGDLSAAIGRLEEVRLRHVELERELAAHPVTDRKVPLSTAYDGVAMLREWLRALRIDEGVAAYHRMLVVVGALVTLGAGVGLALSGALAAAGAAVLAALVLLVLLLVRRPAADPRPNLERRYLALGLPEAPQRWEDATVQSCLEQLESLIGAEMARERLAHRRQEILGALELNAREIGKIAKDLAEVASGFGLALPADGVRLFWLVERVGRWQKARAERLGAEHGFVHASGERQAIIAGANERLESVGIPPVGESRSLKGTVEKLRRDLASYQQLEQGRALAEATLEKEWQQVEQLEADIQRLLDAIGIGPDEEGHLAGWCDQVEECGRAAAAFQVVEAQRDGLEEKLRSLPGFTVELLDAPRYELASQAEALQKKLESLSSLAEEVGALRNRIRSAEDGHAVEEALAEVGVREEALREMRSKELRAAVAALLVEHVERETRNEHLPGVFHRASALFSEITRGAFQLHVSDGSPPSFRAFDTIRERGLALDELSSGTRVQLLLAVRVAFVESLETGVRLPLLMDETLANSDDERATAIIEAVVRLALAGRQVFYFTAQPDEVMKWKRVLAGHPTLEWAAVDLADVRGLESRLDPALLEVATIEPTQVPSPAGLSHAKYGELLRVPRIDPGAPVGSLHLWYLLENSDDLHHLLSELGVARWGELRSLLANGGGELLEEGLRRRLEAGAELAELALGQLRIGRGRSVDRHALVCSGAVSERFLDEVDDLCTRVGGDAVALIAGLESGGVTKFFRKNVEALRTFLEDNGYLDARETRRPDAIAKDLLVEAARSITARRIGASEVARLLRRICAGSGVPIADEPRKAPTVVPEPTFLPDLLAE